MAKMEKKIVDEIKKIVVRFARALVMLENNE